MANDLVLRDVNVNGESRADVRISAGEVAEIRPALTATADLMVDGAGGALLPGLHDHHCHLLAMSAALRSVSCGPPAVRDARELAAALRQAGEVDWIRGVDYDDSVAGPLDRKTLDAMVDARPVRIQHRGGSLWILNSVAIDVLAVGDARGDGVERDRAGHPTGRLWRMDGWLRRALAATTAPDLTDVGRRLAATGVTGVTDASPGPVDGLVSARGTLPQRLMSMGSSEGDDSGMTFGPLKIVVSDHALPSLDSLVSSIRSAHSVGRPVAVHSVTRESILLVLVALEEAGVVVGDRIEHAAVAPREAIDKMRRLDIAVVTQPSFIPRRGDDYIARAASADVDDLWRYASLLAAHVRVGCSSDAPYGDADPWQSIFAARERTTPSGVVLGVTERVSSEVALEGFLSRADDPGGVPRRVAVGMPADLVLLDCALAEMLDTPNHNHVRATIIAGKVEYERSEGNDWPPSD